MFAKVVCQTLHLTLKKENSHRQGEAFDPLNLRTQLGGGERERGEVAGVVTLLCSGDVVREYKSAAGRHLANFVCGGS